MRSTLLATLLAPAAALAEDVSVVHVVPGSHLDIGFTDTPDAVRAKRIRILDDAIAAAEADPEFRWFEENAWVFYVWREARAGDSKALARLKTLLKEGRISAGASWCNPHASMFSEHLHLLFAHLDDFEETFGVRPVAAVLNDCPSHPQAIVDACAAAGVKFLLVGANVAFSPRLPAELEKAPFWWESPKGNRVLTLVDCDSYTAAYTKWGFDPDCARFFNPKEFPPAGGPIETIEKGFSAALRGLSAPRDEIVIQHAFDNWDCGGAKKLPRFAREWNAAKKGPRVSLGGPEAYFRHVEETYGQDLPVRRGEWGGQWDAIRAANPAWTWRLREAMKKLPAGAPLAAKLDLATAIEHSQGLGGGWPGMYTKEQTLASNAQTAALFERAAGGAGLVEPREALPPSREMPRCEGDPVKVKAVLADVKSRMRAGRTWLGPFVANEAPEQEGEALYCMDLSTYALRLRLDRGALPNGDTSVVAEIPLRGKRSELSIAPADSPDACAGRWLTGKAPGFVVAPGGLRVSGLAHPVMVRSDLVFTWCLVADREDEKKTWLQGLLVRQSRQAELKDRSVHVFAFEELYPGEPEKLEAYVELLIE
jgi:hypothetical protein